MGFQGEIGAYSEKAINLYFSKANSKPYKTFSDLFVALENEQIDLAILPIENSIEGVVNHTLDMLNHSSLMVCGEVELRIHHHLLRIVEDLDLSVASNDVPLVALLDQLSANDLDISECIKKCSSLKIPMILLVSNKFINLITQYDQVEDFIVSPFSEEELLKMTVEFLQKSHQLDLEFSPRDGIHILQYALKRLSQEKDHPLSKDEIWKEASSKILVEEAMDLDNLAAKNRRLLQDEQLPMGLGDFFFNDDNPLHPDSDS